MDERNGGTAGVAAPAASFEALLAPVLDALLSAMAILPFDETDAKAAAAIRAALRREGRPIGPYDCQIAGCGLARGLVVVTANEAEFRRIGGLRIENWREA